MNEPTFSITLAQETIHIIFQMFDWLADPHCLLERLTPTERPTAFENPTLDHTFCKVI